MVVSRNTTQPISGANAHKFTLNFARGTFPKLILPFWTPNLMCLYFRAEYGEKTVQKLNLRIDNIMFDLVTEKTKTQNVNDERDQTFELFVAQ